MRALHARRAPCSLLQLTTAEASKLEAVAVTRSSDLPLSAAPDAVDDAAAPVADEDRVATGGDGEPERVLEAAPRGHSQTLSGGAEWVAVTSSLDIGHRCLL